MPTQAEIAAQLAQALTRLLGSKPCPLDPLVESYLAAQTVAVTRRHVGILTSRLARLLRELRSMARAAGEPPIADVADLRLDLIGRWCTQQLQAGMAPNTARQYLIHLRGLTNWAVGEGLLEVNPLTSLRLPPGGRDRETRPRGAFTQDEVVRILAAVRKMDANEKRRWTRPVVPQVAVVVVAAYSAARLGELVSLRWTDWDARQGLLRIRPENAKNGHERHCVLPPEGVAEVEALRSHLRETFGPVEPGSPLLRARFGGSLVGTTVSRWFTALLGPAGIPTIDGAGRCRSFHSLRHFATTRLAAINPEAARLQAGHRSSRTTDRYVHHGAALVRASLGSLPPIEPAAAVPGSPDHVASERGLDSVDMVCTTSLAASALVPDAATSAGGEAYDELAEREGFEPSEPRWGLTRLAI
jgi:integrase